MEELPSAINERNFLNKLLDFTHRFVEPESVKEALKRLHDEEYCNGQKALTIKQTEFLLQHLEGLYEKTTAAALRTTDVCLAHIFVDFIHSTQMLMVYLSPEEGLLAAQERIPYILKQLSIYYFHFYQENPSEAFLDQLDKIIYHAVCFNFQAEVVLKRDTDFKLEKAHRLQMHYGFKTFLTHKKEIFEHEIYALTCIGPQQKNAALKKLDEHHAGLQKTYLEQTLIKPYTNRENRTHITYRGSGILMLFLCLYLYLSGWIIPATLLGLAGGFATFFPINRLARRGLTLAHEKTYTQNAMSHLKTLEVTPGFKQEAKRIRAQFDAAEAKQKEMMFDEKKSRKFYSRDAKERIYNERFSALLEANRLFLTLNFGLRKVKSKTPKKPVVVVPENNTQVVDPVEDTAIAFLSFPDNPDSDAYDTRHINRAYRRRQDRNREASTEKSSYVKVAEVLYTLPPLLQHTACIVTEGPSKMIFDLSIHFDGLSRENQQKFLTGQFRVVAKRGQNGGFKHLKSGEYELKLPPSNVTENKHLRFFLTQADHKEVTSSDGKTHQIPYYRATRTGGK